MNDPGAPSLDWSAVLTRAHRRVAVRLVLAGAIGAVGAALLLGGGVATRAAIQGDDPAAIHGNEPPPPPLPPSPPAEQPNLMISAALTGAVEEGGEEEQAKGEATEEGEFTVVNDSSTNAEAFSVFVTTSEEEPQVYDFSGGLPGGKDVSKRFRCPAGDHAILEIDSGQIDEPDSEEIECVAVPIETTETTTETTPTTPETTDTEPTEPTDTTKSAEEELK